MLGISRSTLYRRLESYGISSNSYTNISQSDLKEVVHEIKKEHPILVGKLCFKAIFYKRELRFSEINL